MMGKTQGYGGLVLGLFFASGGTALVYEVVWSKYLALMFGSTIQAQTVVLAVFMGGLALGNKIFGGRSDRMERPLTTYGFIEIAIGVFAFVFPWLHQWADQVFIAVGTRWFEHGWVLLCLKGILSVGLLLIPTVLMGGTLPLLAAWLQQGSGDATRSSARFYSVNSLGAMTGAGVAGFFLVQNLGLVSTLQTTALLNGVIGLLAILVERMVHARERTAASTGQGSPNRVNGGASAGARPNPGREGIGLNFRAACLLVGVSGGVSMGLEVLAARSLSLIFGSNLQSFAIVLVSFILGIGLGSGLIASAKASFWRSERAVAWLLVAAAVWVGVLVFKIEWWVEFYRLAKSGLARSSMGYVYYQALAALLSMVVLGVPAALIGSVLPLLIRLVAGETLTLGRHVGRLLTWNTLGAVVGTLLTGFVLMPHVGLRGSFGVLASVLCLAAVVLSLARRQKSVAGIAGGALAFLVLLFAVSGEGWRHVLSSGVFRAKETEVFFNVMDQRKQHIKILFYEDAPDATVSIEQGDGVGAPDDIGLRINGKTDASSRSDLSTQLLVGHLPLLARPDAKDVFILGLGSGITGGAVLAHPVERLVVAENCEPVVRAAKFFEPWNRGVLSDPRSRVLVDDARTVLKLSPRTYDVIITQPSNPWMAGVGSVFSREYYELGATRLNPGGVMVQWFQVYEMDDSIVEMVMRTFRKVFPVMEIWDTGTGDIVMVGSKQTWSSSPADLARGFERAGVRTDMAKIGISSVNALFARQLASQPTAFAIAREGRMQSDLFPRLEYEAPRSFYLGISSTMLGRFDERTWQRELASPEKAAAIASLSTEEVRSVFGEHQSVNDELTKLLVWQYPRQGQGATGPHPGERVANMPSLFGSRDRPIKARIPAQATEEEATLLTAVAELRSRRPAHGEALRTVEGILQARSSDPAWSHWSQAAVAAKAYLETGEVAQARKIVELARRFSPNDRELTYISRVLERHGARPSN
jgi:spermidine synthase